MAEDECDLVVLTEVGDPVPGEHAFDTDHQPVEKGLDRVWLGTTEDYILSRDGDYSRLVIEIKAHEYSVHMFNNAWPNALSIIKELS